MAPNSAVFELSDLDGNNGFAIIGSSFLSGSDSSAGDINGDGFDDLIIGASSASPNGQPYAGESYVVFGKKSGFGANFDLSFLDGNNGFVLNGIDAGDSSGFSVSSGGDINGDGIDDVVIGTRYGEESYVVFGKNGEFGASFNLSDLNGSNGFVLNGINADDKSRKSVSNAGDFNGDGIDDLIIGAYRTSDNDNFRAGESYIVFGKNGSFGASVNLSDLNGSNGFALKDINGDVSSAGDINGDGIDDLIIGAGGADPNEQRNAGESYVVFGFQIAATTNEDTAVNILASNILRRYTDAEGNTLTISDFTNPTNGTLILNDNNTGNDFFIYTPNANFNGTDSFTFTVSDGNGGSTIGTFNLNVKPVNDAPVATNDPLTTTFNTAVSIPASNLLNNDTDIDSSNLSITGVSSVSNGTAVLNDNGTQNNSTDDFIVFTPTNGFSGNANFNYIISDGSLTNQAKVAITVGANITGNGGNDTISDRNRNDLLLGGNDNDTLVFRLGDGHNTITNFAGTGIGSNPSAAVITQLDTLQFIGSR
jgi:hypothetical protein